MGNCMGKKSSVQSKHHRYSPCNNQLGKTQILLSSSSSSDQTHSDLSHISDIKKADILFNNEEKIVQHSSSITTITNDRFIFVHPSSTILSPDQLSFQYKKFKSSNTVRDFNENNIIQSIILRKNEEDTTMGYLFSKEKKQEIPIFTQEIISESFDASPSSSLSNSSFSSLSCNSTSFSSQDQLILSSSSSSIDIKPILSSYFHNRSYENEIFSTIFPASISRYNNDSFLHEFHQNTISHNCKTLCSVIDDVIQQQCIRIHRQTKTILIEHKQFQCAHLNDVNKLDTPSLIFDEDKKLVYITKYARWNGLQSITYNTKDISRIFSSCDHCSLLLSGSKLNKYLRSFLIVNTTYNLIQICFNEINKNNLFGYISQIHSNQIQQIIIDNSKLNYSYDLDVDYTNFYFVLYVQSWPKEIRSIYEKRQRLWPLNIENLFDKTCFIRYNGNEYEISTNDQCFNCEKILSSLSNSSWSYTYAAIESQLVLLMSDGHIRFASIVWNYLNGKTQGKLPFTIFKHTLFYFLEKYSSDSFTTSDLLCHISLFIDFLFNCLQTKFIPHYFNSNYNLYNDNISMNFISIKMTYLDLKNFSIYLLPKSSLYLYHLMYLIQFQTNFVQYFCSSKTNLTQTILDTHEFVIKQLSLGVKTYKRQLDSTIAIKSHRPLTLDCLYRYQEENVQIILNYLPLLREKEPSIFIHSLWSIFIQYFNSLFDDLFIS